MVNGQITAEDIVRLYELHAKPVGSTGLLGGVKVVTDPMVPAEFHGYVRRPWRVRLFSWPWRPWQKQRWVDQLGMVYQLQDGTFIMHPSTAAIVTRITSGR